MGVEVHREIRGSADVVDQAAAATHDDTQARQQFLEGEGLDEVVICSGVETFDAVLDPVERSEEEHRRGAALLGAQVLEDLVAVCTGHHDVEHGGVILGTGKVVDRLCAVEAAIDDIAFLGQALGQSRVKLRLVLDN